MNGYNGISLFAVGGDKSTLHIPTPINRRSGLAPSLQEANKPSVTVTISDAARRAAATASTNQENTGTIIDLSLELRELIKQYDFRNITPRQMANLAGELFDRKVISQDAASNFIGVEKDTFVERNLDKPMDMIAHFQLMLDVVETNRLTDPSSDFAVANRKHGSQTLADIISFAVSERTEISTHQGVSVQDLQIEREKQHIRAKLFMLAHPAKIFLQL